MASPAYPVTRVKCPGQRLLRLCGSDLGLYALDQGREPFDPVTLNEGHVPML